MRTSDPDARTAARGRKRTGQALLARRNLDRSMPLRLDRNARFEQDGQPLSNELMLATRDSRAPSLLRDKVGEIRLGRELVEESDELEEESVEERVGRLSSGAERVVERRGADEGVGLRANLLGRVVDHDGVEGRLLEKRIS